MEKKDDVAVIHQLVPMPDRHEFHYLFLNEAPTKREILFYRVPMLGVALIDFPGPAGFEQMIVHFGVDAKHGDMHDFCFYTGWAWRAKRFVFPFFQEDPWTRALGIAPHGSPDDYFDDLIEEIKKEWGETSVAA